MTYHIPSPPPSTRRTFDAAHSLKLDAIIIALEARPEPADRQLLLVAKRYAERRVQTIGGR